MKKTIGRFAIMLCLSLTLAAMLCAGDKTPAKSEKQTTQASSEGEKRFQAHCGRCHEVPEDIPRSVAGTVVKHMRIRANLTEEDEKLILQYIRP